MYSRQFYLATFLTVSVLLLFAPGAQAQEGDGDKRFEIKGVLGLAWIDDELATRVPPEAVFNQLAAGLAARLYPWGADRGFAIEAEYFYIRESEPEENYVFLGNFIWEA